MNTESVRAKSRAWSAFFDYQVFDHLQRVADGRYMGASKNALNSLHELAGADTFEPWMARISQVEMCMGVAKPGLSDKQKANAAARDRGKLSIAADLAVTWLEYPGSRLDDPYSLMDITFSPDGSPEVANFEAFLATVGGISPGDVRQVSSMVYGRSRCGRAPNFRWFVTEDKGLREALKGLQRNNDLRFANLEVLSVQEFVDTVGRERMERDQPMSLHPKN